jgi:hypothetical protein
MAAPVETKVVAATAGSGVGAILATFTLWLLGVFVWDVSADAAQADKAIAAVPTPVAGLVLVMLSAVAAAIGGWLAPHTSRTPPPEVSRPAGNTTAAAMFPSAR